MKNQTPRKRYPLHIHIASLFTILILTVGVTLAWFSYRQISNLAFDNTEVLFSKTADELLLRFQKDYGPVATSIRLLATAPGNFLQRRFSPSLLNQATRK